jgi:ornithine cyclodeaminase
MKLVDVNGIRKLIVELGFPEFFHMLMEYIREDLKSWSNFSKKERVAFYLQDGIIELMPVAGKDYFANKFVCTHPNNHHKSKYGVMALGLWVDTHSGEPLLLSEMTFLTALRTATVSVLVSLLMAPSHAKKFAIIGCGAQSHFQVLAHHIFLNFNEVRCFDVRKNAMQRLIEEMSAFGIKVKACDSAWQAAKNADVITTATNALRLHPILDASILHPELHINAIGGDAPGYSELDPSIIQQVDRIAVEYLPQTQHEGEIQQLPYHMIQDKVIEVFEMSNGLKKGRARADEITLFDSVGFAAFDYSTLRLISDLSKKYNFTQEIDLLPEFDANKSLFKQLIDGKL